MGQILMCQSVELGRGNVGGKAMEQILILHRHVVWDLPMVLLLVRKNLLKWFLELILPNDECDGGFGVSCLALP
eukprot:2904045-Ditylum_brightwellii.AAC.1